ncbi:MAG TPA: PAS domain-containing protein, partial [Rhodothermales bacterium]|nr:PAS domain-containing protein [Rhodothermales bacterium]
DVTEERAATAALTVQTAELQAITDHAEDVILRVDRDLRYLFANPATLHVLGVPPEAFIGKTYTELGLDPEAAEGRARYLRGVFETGEPATYDLEFTLANGENRIVHSHAVPERRDADGRVETLLVFGRDVTEQRAAEAAVRAKAAELQAITDHADDLILRFDRDLRYLFANPATLHVLGVPPEALIGRTDAELARDPALAAEREVYLRRVFETGEPAAYEVDVPLPDGGRLVLHLHALPERRDAGGRVETVLVIARNVTAQRAADDTLRARATELQAITDHTDDVIVRFDRDHRYLFVNAALERLTGRTAAEFVGTPLEAGLSPELIARWTSGLREVFATGTPLDVPYTLQTPAGPRRFLARVAPETFDAGGRVETVLVVARDFTALHDTTAALRARAAELQTITHHTEDLIIRYDRALRHLYINPALERLTGFPPEHFLGKTNVEIGLPPGHAEGYAAALREVLETGEPADFTFDAPRPDGTTGHLVARMVPDTRDAEGRVETVLAVTRDFTALHEATRAVRERAAELQAITDHAEDVITRFDRDLHYLFVNPAIERFTGLQPEAFLGRKLREREIGGADLEPWAREIEAVFATGEPRDAAFESVTPTGPRYIHARIVPERKADGHVETVLVVTRDVTAEHAAAEALRESERRFREVVESAPGGIVVADLAGRITLVNRRAEALFGYMRGELIGGPVERLALAGVAGPGGAPSAGADLYARRKDGSTFPVEIALTPIETETGPAVLTTVIDVTQRKAAEAALRASEERMRGVLEATPDAFFAVDSDWRFTYVNPHAEALWGVAP